MRAVSLKRLPERWRIRALILLAPFFLGACAMVGPDFESPGVPWLDDWSSNALKSVEKDGQSQGDALLDEWWRNFDDPILEQVVEQAQDLHLEVRTAGMRILEARAQLGIAGSGLYP